MQFKWLSFNDISSGTIHGATFSDDTPEDVRAAGDDSVVGEGLEEPFARERLNSTGAGINFQEFVSRDRKSR